MSIFSRAKENQVQNGLSIFIQGDADEFCIGQRDSLRGREFTANSMNLSGRNSKRLQQKVIGQFEIALGVLRRNATLIRPKKTDTGK